MASMFYEVSTRTSCSFTAAIQHLGGTVVFINEHTSSAKKGETLLGSGGAVTSSPDVVVFTIYVNFNCLFYFICGRVYYYIDELLIAFANVDTVTMMNCYADVLVIRHPDCEAMQVLVALRFRCS